MRVSIVLNNIFRPAPHTRCVDGEDVLRNSRSTTTSRTRWRSPRSPKTEEIALSFNVSQHKMATTIDRPASTITTDPYADYATLLSASFTPSTHANSLVLSTNDPSDKITDLTSPAQRVQYDLEEVNRRIDSLVYSIEKQL